MSETDAHGALIGRLTAGLEPVKVLRPPWLRAFLWLCGFAGLAAILFAFRSHRGSEAGIYVLIGIVASTATAALAAIAAFELSLPDRNGAWALLPLPTLLVWLAASGLGCLANLAQPDVWGVSMVESGECLAIIIGLSIPLSALMVVMLRRASPLRPNLVAVVAGLAVAGAASTLLIFVHPHDSAVLDLGAHTIAIALVIGANVLFGGRLLARELVTGPR